MKKNAKIYIAGHLGLVGSAITKSLKNKGYNNLILRSKKELNLINQNEVRKFFNIEKPEYVIIAAAKVGGIRANNNLRGEFIYENILIQSNLIHCSHEFFVKKLIFLGSTCIYPKKTLQPITEESLLTSDLEYTNEPYAIAKISGIKLCESYNLQYGCNFLSLMPTNLFGPNDNFDLKKSHVLPAILRKIHLGKCLENGDWNKISSDFKTRPVTENYENLSREEKINLLSDFGINFKKNKVEVEIWGSGKPLREFLWSEDLADAVVHTLENINFMDIVNYNKQFTPNFNYKEIKNCHLNVGSGKEISIYDLSFLIKKIIDFDGDLFFNKSKPDGTQRKLTDISKLKYLGWSHKIKLVDAIKLFYNYYLKSINT